MDVDSVTSATSSYVGLSPPSSSFANVDATARISVDAQERTEAEMETSEVEAEVEVELELMEEREKNNNKLTSRPDDSDWMTTSTSSLSSSPSLSCPSSLWSHSQEAEWSIALSSLSLVSLSSLARLIERDSVNADSSKSLFLSSRARFFHLIKSCLQPEAEERLEVLTKLFEVVHLLLAQCPSHLLLARGEEKRSAQECRDECFWSTIVHVLIINLSVSSSSSSSSSHPVSTSLYPVHVLSQIYRLAASAYPTTMTLIARLGDQSGTVCTALEQFCSHIGAHFFPHSNLIVPPSPLVRLRFSWLCRSAFAFIDALLLCHLPHDREDYNTMVFGVDRDITVLSASKLSSFPVLIDETPLYSPGVSVFDLELLDHSHPDLEKRSMMKRADLWLDGLLAVLNNEVKLDITLLRSYAPSALQTLLYLARQRSDVVCEKLVPFFVQLYKTLQSTRALNSVFSTLGATAVSSTLYMLRLGLFSLYRLPSCSRWWPELLALISKPAHTLVALNALEIAKSKRFVPSKTIPHNAVAPTSSEGVHEAVVASSSSLADDRTDLDEIIDIASPVAIEMFRVMATLPLAALANVVLSSMNNLTNGRSAYLSEQSVQLAHTQRKQTSQMLFMQTLASMKQNDVASTNAAEKSKKPAVAVDNVSAAPIKSQHMTALAPALTIKDLDEQSAATLARSSYVRILSLVSEHDLTVTQHSTLRSIILTKLSAISHKNDVAHTLTLPSSFDPLHVDESIFSLTGESQFYQEIVYSSSLCESADYQALLTYVLSDLQHRYSVAVRWCYQLLFIKPNRITLVHQSSNEDEVEMPPSATEELALNVDSANDSFMTDDTASTSKTESILRAEQELKRKFEYELKVEGGDSAQLTDEAAPVMKRIKIEVNEEAEKAEKKEITNAEIASLIKPDGDRMLYTNEPIDTFAVTSTATLSNSPLLQSTVFFRNLRHYLMLNGGVEYEYTVTCVLSGFESALATNNPQARSTLQPSVIAQFLLDLPVLPQVVWQTLTRFLSHETTFSMGILALRALILFKPTATGTALQLLLDTIQYTTDTKNREQCVHLAVNLVKRESQRRASLTSQSKSMAISAPSAQTARSTEYNAETMHHRMHIKEESKESLIIPSSANEDGKIDDTKDNLTSVGRHVADIIECTPTIVAFAVTQSGAVSEENFLQDLPVIEVNVVVPPEPIYDEIQLPPEPAADMKNIADVEMKDDSSNEVHSADGDSVQDQARMREIQSLIQEAAQRKREFEKLTLRRALLVKEKEILDKRHALREEERSRRVQHHLILFFALLLHHNSLALFSHLLRVYQRAPDSARCMIHTFLPELVINVGAVPSLLAAIRALHVGTEPCVLHILQLLCGNLAEPKKSMDRSSNAHSAITPHSSVFALCWQLFALRNGDARFLVPIAPLLSADQVRRTLHRIVQLPPIHLKIMFQRILKPQMSISAKGSRMQATNVQYITPVDLVVHIHRIDAKRKLALERMEPVPASSENSNNQAVVNLDLDESKQAVPEKPTAPSPSWENDFPKDDYQWLRFLVHACQQCYFHIDLFPPSVFAQVLNSLKEDRPLPRLLLRTMIQALSFHSNLSVFVLDIAVQCTRASTQIVESPSLFEGLIKLFCLTLPTSVTAFVSMPEKVHRAVLSSYTPGTDLPVPKKGHKLTPQQQIISTIVQFVRAQPQRATPVLRLLILGDSKFVPQPTNAPTKFSTAMSGRPLPLPPAPGTHVALPPHPTVRLPLSTAVPVSTSLPHTSHASKAIASTANPFSLYQSLSAVQQQPQQQQQQQQSQQQQQQQQQQQVPLQQPLLPQQPFSRHQQENSWSNTQLTNSTQNRDLHTFSLPQNQSTRQLLR